MLNWIWAAFFFVAFLVGLFRWLVLGEAGVWAAMVGSSFEMAKTGFEVSLGLAGVTSLWLWSAQQGDARRLEGTEGASGPFFSPDGREVGATLGLLRSMLLLLSDPSVTHVAVAFDHVIQLFKRNRSGETHRFFL